MINYDDFPLLSDQQYTELNLHYNNKNSKTDTLKSIATTLQFCIDSFFAIRPDFNLDTQNQISALTNELKEVKSSLKILFPNLTFNSKELSSNLFTILNNLLNVCTQFTDIAEDSEKNYYKKVLLKLNTRVLNSLSMLMLTLSKQDVKFFKHM